MKVIFCYNIKSSNKKWGVLMRIAVIDGMGGGLAAQIVSQLVSKLPDNIEIIGLGTNSLATAAMIKAGVKRGATGENAICVSAKTADIIVGPIGIIIPNAMMGEVTPKIAEAIASVKAKKILLPVNQTHFEIIGVESKSMATLVKEATNNILRLVEV